jgi:hypothetical protein
VVYAIERTAAIELVREHAAAAGLAEVVVPLRRDVVELDGLPRPPRVIVGEMLGHFAPAEGQHRLYRHVRRWAAPDAVAIPARYQLTFAAARPESGAAAVEAIAAELGVALDALAARLRHRVGFARLTAGELAGPEVVGDSYDSFAPTPTTFTAAVPVATAGPVTAIAVSFVAELAPGVVLSSAVGAEATHWIQTLLPIDPPLACAAGDVIAVELHPRVMLAASTWAWTVRCGAEARFMDAADALIGDVDDTLAQLGARRRVPPPAPLHLRAWAAALGATPPDVIDVEAMTDRLCQALPREFADRGDARQEVLALVHALTRSQ